MRRLDGFRCRAAFGGTGLTQRRFSLAQALWCGSGPLFSSWGKKLSEPSKQALAQPYTVIEDDLRAFARAVLKLCVSHRGVVAVPVLAPWRAPTCWGPVMSGNLQRRTNARERGRMQPLCKESRHVLILSKSGHKSRAAIARPIESSRPIETAYRSQPDPKSAARCPKKTKSSDTAKRNTRNGAPAITESTQRRHRIDATQVPLNARHRLPQARPRGT